MWVGYLFDWNAIVAMQQKVQSNMNDFFDHMAADLKGDRKEFNEYVRSYIILQEMLTMNSLVQLLTEQAKAKLEPSNDNTKASSVTTQQAPGLQSNQSAPSKWFSHQAKHGGVTDVQQVDTIGQL